MRPISSLIEQHYAKRYPSLNIESRIEEDVPVFRLGQSLVSFTQALICETDTAVSWIERNDKGYYAKIIYKADNRLWEERLPGERKDYGEFDFFSCKWIEGHLFLIYLGRWHEYHICSLKDFVLRYVRVEGENLLVLERELSYQDMLYFDNVRRLSVPELELIEVLSSEEANRQRIMPNGDFYFFYNNAHGLL